MCAPVFSAPKPKAETPPSVSDPNIQAEKEAERRRLRAAQGRSSTIVSDFTRLGRNTTQPAILLGQGGF